MYTVEKKIVIVVAVLITGVDRCDCLVQLTENRIIIIMTPKLIMNYSHSELTRRQTLILQKMRMLIANCDQDWLF